MCLNMQFYYRTNNTDMETRYWQKYISRNHNVFLVSNSFSMGTLKMYVPRICVIMQGALTTTPTQSIQTVAFRKTI